MGVWYTYVDWTLEHVPRPFNVGKGTASRVADVIARNDVWHRIARKHGHRREVVFASSVEAACYDREQELIREYRTSPLMDGGWGANLSLGGSGPTGARWTDTSREGLSRSIVALWRRPEYRRKLMMPSPSSAELAIYGAIMTWDAMATRYDVSSTTVKRWFSEAGIVKVRVAQERRAWDVVEEERLWELYVCRKSVREIARILERSECSVKKRVQRMCDKRGVKRSRYRRCG